MLYLDLLLSVVFISTGLFFLFRPGRKNLPLPPGRKGWPLLGNLLEIPSKFEWKTYHQWSKELHTDILCLNVAGTNIIVLDTLETATDFLEKRSSIYSGRARMPMVNELMGWEFHFGGMDYGNEWRQRRRLMDQQLHPITMRQFHPHLLKVARGMLSRFVDESEYDVMEISRHMVGEIIMSIGYGLQVQPHDDPYVTAAKESVQILSMAAVPGTFLVDSFPFLKYVPEWVPGAGFKKKAREWKRKARMMIEAPYVAAKKNIESGIFEPSFVSLNLERMNEGLILDLYTEQIIKEVAGTIYAGGADTSVAAIGACILGLVYRPDVVAKAQEELDRVLQTGHLPDFNDQESLPYITAIVKESLRWREVAPIGVPHHLKTDDVYRGYRIPAGSLIIANAWAILHDEKTYPDPFTFNPDRFIKNGKLDSSILDPESACWGFGRRICPGRHLAFASIWIAVASLLTVFDIKKSVDDEGKVIEPFDEVESAIVCMPKPFKCSVAPRSQSAKALIQLYRN